MSVHKVSLYEMYLIGDKPAEKNQRFDLLKRYLRSIINKGRVPLNARIIEHFDFLRAGYITMCYGKCYYIGRKTVNKPGLRHDSRKKYIECQVHVASATSPL